MPGLPSRRQFLAVAAAGAAAVALPSTANATTADPTVGIRWPAGQALPSFGRPRSLDVANLTGRPADEQLLLTTLQGVVNRDRPSIYLIQPQNEGPTTWLAELGVPYQQVSEPLDLLTRYRDRVRGAIVHDPAVPATVNVATTLAGLRDGVVTSAELAASAGLPVLVDLRGRFSTDLAAYTWAVDNLWSSTSHRLLIGLDPNVAGYLRDYAVANRAMCVFLDPATAGEGPLLSGLLADLPTPSPYLGWWPASVNGEDDGTQLTSQHGVYVLAADWCTNLTVLGGVPAPILASQQPTPTPALANKIYVTLTMTEGDNLQYAQHRMRQIWDDPNRGKVPLNWSTQPLAADAAPTVLSYYQRTATPNDYLMAGPSGAGYVYPSDWPADTLAAYTRQAARYTRRTGLAAQVILNRLNGNDIPFDAATAARYSSDLRPLGLLMAWTTYTSTSVLAGNTPLSVSWLASSVAEATQAIATASQGWTGDKPLFLSIGTLAWNLTPTDVVTIAGSLGPNYQVVRGDHYFALARQAFGLPSH
ncbi:MAG TPA: GxGYxYP domain-containing protein [Pseudonocardiaceae bacterium]|jgi:hypothetical protein|nr:GxGYxYP domain-containing protein [Pseudonocardiaceae bacterium]